MFSVLRFALQIHKAHHIQQKYQVWPSHLTRLSIMLDTQGSTAHYNQCPGRFHRSWNHWVPFQRWASEWWCGVGKLCVRGEWSEETLSDDSSGQRVWEWETTRQWNQDVEYSMSNQEFLCVCVRAYMWAYTMAVAPNIGHQCIWII